MERFNGSFWMLVHVRRRFDLLLDLFLVATSIWITAQEVTHCPLELGRREEEGREREETLLGLHIVRLQSGTC